MLKLILSSPYTHHKKCSSIPGRRGKTVQTKDPHRGPTAEEGHGLHRRGRPRRRHEGQRQLLDLERGVPGEGCPSRIRKTHAGRSLVRAAWLAQEIDQ